MLYKFLIIFLLAHNSWAAPVDVVAQTHPVGDVPSRIVIVTPQAEVHLEPALKYEAQPAFIQNLAPLARIADPQVILYPVQSAPVNTPVGQTKQYGEIWESIQNAVQTGAELSSQQLNEAANAAVNAAQQAGTNLFPGLFPGSDNKDGKPDQAAATAKPAELTPAATQPLITDGRSFYALTPARTVPHIIDIVHGPFAGPVLVAPAQTIRARSIENAEMPIVALPIPETPKPEALPMATSNKKKTELKENKETKKIEAEKEKEKQKLDGQGRSFDLDAEIAQAQEYIKKKQQEQKEYQANKEGHPLYHQYTNFFEEVFPGRMIREKTAESSDQTMAKQTTTDAIKPFEETKQETTKIEAEKENEKQNVDENGRSFEYLYDQIAQEQEMKRQQELKDQQAQREKEQQDQYLLQQIFIGRKISDKNVEPPVQTEVKKVTTDVVKPVDEKPQTKVA